MVSSRTTRRLLLGVVATDATFHRVGWRGAEVFEGKCLHCRTRLHLALDGTPISRATLEHIVPRNHGGTDALDNLAIACARCNHGKGARLDRRRADDPDLVRVIEALRAERLRRWREPEAAD